MITEMIMNRSIARNRAISKFVNFIKKPNQSVTGFIDANIDKFWCDKGSVYYCDVEIFNEEKI